MFQKENCNNFNTQFASKSKIKEGSLSAGFKCFNSCEDEGSKSFRVWHRVDLQLGYEVLDTLAVNFVRVEAVQELILGY
jgi:hypothetical protein